MKNTRFILILGIVMVLLLIPFIGMQLNEVDWSVFDFIVAAVLLAGTGLTIEFALRKIKSSKNRIIICGIILTILFIVWTELALGILDTAIAGN